MYYLDAIINKAGFFLFDWIKELLGLILNGLFLFFERMGITNAALCIIVFTLLIRTLMVPLTIKTQKMSKMSSVIQPEVQKIQAKYKNKRDQDSMNKMNRELQAVYEKYGTSPTSGCLSSLITLPIMIALYRVINDITTYVPAIYDVYEKAAEAIKGFSGFSSLEAFKDTSSVDDIVNVLKNYSSQDWSSLSESIKGDSSCQGIVASCADEIQKINSFIGGLNIADAPTKKPWPGLLIPVFSVVTQWYSMAMIQNKNKNDKSMQDNPTAQSMQMMMKIMPLFSGFICLTLPLGVGIYWITGSVFIIVQQYIVGKKMDKVDMDELIASNKKKAQKKAESKEKSIFWKKVNELKTNAELEMQNSQNSQGTPGSGSLKDYAKLSSKTIDSKDSDTSKSSDVNTNKNTSNNNNNRNNKNKKKNSNKKDVNNSGKAGNQANKNSSSDQSKKSEDVNMNDNPNGNITSFAKMTSYKK